MVGLYCCQSSLQHKKALQLQLHTALPPESSLRHDACKYVHLDSLLHSRRPVCHRWLWLHCGHQPLLEGERQCWHMPQARPLMLFQFSLVFKCFCDIIILDDFRSALEKIRHAAMRRISEDQNNVNHFSGVRPHRAGRSLSIPLGTHVSIRSSPTSHYKFPSQETDSTTSDGVKMASGETPCPKNKSGGNDKIHIRTELVTRHESAES